MAFRLPKSIFELRVFEGYDGRRCLCDYGICGRWFVISVQDSRPNLPGTSEASAAVYVGCVWQEYHTMLEHQRIKPTVNILTGSGMNFMVGRVSYTFGLQGTLSMAYHVIQLYVDLSNESLHGSRELTTAIFCTDQGTIANTHSLINALTVHELLP